MFSCVGALGYVSRSTSCVEGCGCAWGVQVTGDIAHSSYDSDLSEFEVPWPSCMVEMMGMTGPRRVRLKGQGLKV